MPRALSWLALTVYFAAVIVWSWNPTPLAQLLAAVAILGAFVHGGIAYGWRAVTVFLLICLVVTFSIENLGVATGFPFGRYHFETGAGLPHIGAIPVIVGFLWFGMGYFSWAVAAILLGGADHRLGETRNLILLPIAAALAMTFWDLVMDAPESTIAHAWIWHEGGTWFGVPLTNFAGWLLTAWLFCQGFALYLRRAQNMRLQNRAMGAVAILFYLSAGLTHLTPWLMRQSGRVADAAGHVWVVGDLRQGAVITLFLTMVPVSLLAALRLARRPFEDSIIDIQ